MDICLTGIFNAKHIFCYWILCIMHDRVQSEATTWNLMRPSLRFSVLVNISVFSSWHGTIVMTMTILRHLTWHDRPNRLSWTVWRMWLISSLSAAYLDTTCELDMNMTLNFVTRTLPSDLWTAPSWHQRPGTHPCPSPTGLEVIIIDISTKISTKYPCLPVDGIL